MFWNLQKKTKWIRFACLSWFHMVQGSPMAGTVWSAEKVEQVSIATVFVSLVADSWTVAIGSRTSLIFNNCSVP